MAKEARPARVAAALVHLHGRSGVRSGHWQSAREAGTPRSWRWSRSCAGGVRRADRGGADQPGPGAEGRTVGPEGRAVVGRTRSPWRRPALEDDSRTPPAARAGAQAGAASAPECPRPPPASRRRSSLGKLGSTLAEVESRRFASPSAFVSSTSTPPGTSSNLLPAPPSARYVRHSPTVAGPS